MTARIYMDHHATTPTDPRVVEAMLPYFTERFGNPASALHAHGQEAEEAVEVARGQVAALLGARPEEILFTSGATESNNLALRGAALGQARGLPILTAATEHVSVLDPCRDLAHGGASLSVLPVDAQGTLAAERVAEALAGRPALVSVMLANNEIGTLQPVAEIARACRECGAMVHTDAAQAAGRVPVDVDGLGVDLLSVSGHKMHGPKGVGALYVRGLPHRSPLAPVSRGGGQEGGLRPGTLNVPGIVGLGAACDIARREQTAESARVAHLRDRLQAGILARVQGVQVNGHPAHRLPGNLNLTFQGVDGEALMLALPGIALSSGSACLSTTREPSHVLLALGRTPAQARGSLRFGLGRFTTEAEVDQVIGEVARAVERLRALSPVQLPARPR